MVHPGRNCRDREGRAERLCELCPGEQRTHCIREQAASLKVQREQNCTRCRNLRNVSACCGIARCEDAGLAWRQTQAQRRRLTLLNDRLPRCGEFVRYRGPFQRCPTWPAISSGVTPGVVNLLQRLSHS